MVLGLACLGLILWGCDQSTTERNQELSQLRKQVEELSTRLEQQSAVLHRALGKVIPVQIPDEALTRLKALEAHFDKPEGWPGSATQAEVLRRELDCLVKQHLPPWAEEELLPRLNVLRWHVRAVWLLRQQAGAAVELAQDMGEELRSLLAAAPEGCSADLVREVGRQRETLRKQAEQHRRVWALRQADLALQGKVELLSALEALHGLTSPEVEEKRGQLRHRWLDVETEKKLTLLQHSLEGACRLPGEAIQQAALLKVQDAIAGLMLDLELEKPARSEMRKRAHDLLEKCEAQVRGLQHKQRLVQDAKWHAYQKWALEMILAFDGDHGWYYDCALPRIQEQLRSFKHPAGDIPEWPLFKCFPSTKQLLHEKLGVDLSYVVAAEVPAGTQREIFSKAWALRGWCKDIDIELAYRTTRDGMVTYLLPINPNLLDPPLACLYNKAFQKGWNKLEGREDQLFVGQQAALVPRRGLD